METSLNAIVLRRYDLGESDRRIVFLTRERGRLEAIARGARKSGSRLAGATEPLSLVEVSLALGKKQAYITQVQPKSAFRRLRQDYDRLTAALAIAEILSSLSTHELINEELFNMAVQSLTFLESAEDVTAAAVWSMLKLLDLEGVLPVFEECLVSGSPLSENPAWFSLQAGGYVHSLEAMAYTNRSLVPAEVLIGLGRTASLDFPPSRLKFGPAAAALAVEIWRFHADRRLPACDSWLQTLTQTTLEG